MKKYIMLFFIGNAFQMYSADSSLADSKIQTVYIPVESRCSRDEFFSLWVDSQKLDRAAKHVQGDFIRQHDSIDRFEIPRGRIVQDGSNMIDPSVRFLYLVMEAEFEHDQKVQLQIANSGNAFLGRAPKYKTLDEFTRFQFRKGGPQTLTVTKTGREILASLVVQYPEPSVLLTRFATDKKIAPVCLEKMQEFAQTNTDIEKMRSEGKYK